MEGAGLDDAVSRGRQGKYVGVSRGSPWWRQLHVPDGAVSWPPHCTNCGAPADRVVEIRSEDSRAAPLSGVPYCSNCLTRRERLLALKPQLFWKTGVVVAVCGSVQAIVLGMRRSGLIFQRTSNAVGVVMLLVMVGAAGWAVWRYRTALARARIGEHVTLGFPIRVMKPPGRRVSTTRILLVKRDSVAEWLLRNPDVTEGKRFFYVRAIA